MDKNVIISELEKGLEANKLIKKEYYKDKFYEFNKNVMGWPDIYEPLHRPLCNFVVRNKSKHRLIELPREHLKSSIITVSYCVWKIVNDPNVTILISNATEPKAKDFLRQIKDTLKLNTKLIAIYGDLTVDAPVWAEDQIKIKRSNIHSKEPTVTVYGIGGSLTSAHYDLLIFDDLVNRDNVSSLDKIAKVVQFYKDCQALRSGSDTEFIVIGTPWSDYDLYAWIKDKKNNVHQDFVFMNIPAWEGEFRKGVILYPTRFSWDDFDKLRRQMGVDFYAQYMLDPTPSEEATFKKEYFKTFEPSDFKDRELKYFLTVDPAMPGEVIKVKSDSWGFAVVAVSPENDWYVWKLVREKFDPKQGIDKIFELDREFKLERVGIETTAFQRVLKYFTQEEMKKRNQWLNLIELKHAGRGPGVSKKDRIGALQPRYAAGSIYHNPEDPLTEDLQYELLHYPKARHDDLSDALASTLEIAFAPRGFVKKQQQAYGKTWFYRSSQE